MNWSDVKSLWWRIKIAFLKSQGWRDVFHNEPFFESQYTVRIYGKKIEGCKILNYSDDVAPPGGMYPFYIELPDGCIFNVFDADIALYHPVCRTKRET